MKDQVYVCGTHFHLIVSALKSIYSSDKNTKKLLIVNDHTPNLLAIAEKLVANGYFDRCLYVPFFAIDNKIKYQHLFGKIFLRNRTILNHVERDSTILTEHEFIKNAEINLFYSMGLPSVYFILRFKRSYFRMLEDGLRNYCTKVGWFKLFKRKFILRTALGEGRDKCIKSIEVQFPERLPKHIRHKGVKLEFNKMLKELDEVDKKNILSIFLGDHTFEQEARKSLLLLTQPLSEDKHTDEKTKIDIYQTIIRKYQNDYKIFIKPHPRELTIYKNVIDSDFIEIPGSFPLELLNIVNNIKFDKCVTVFSSAIDNISFVQDKVFLGYDYIKNYKQNSNSVSISAVIITFNEESKIERCIRSLQKVADEIVVVDSYSTDNTESICKNLGVKFIQNKFSGYRDQKNFASKQATYDIILSLDADEALSVELEQSILEVKKSWKFNAYKFSRLNNYCGQWIYHSNWYPDRKVRLFDRRKGEWGGLNIHETVKMQKEARVGILKGDLLHWSLSSYEEHIDKANRFSTISANEYFKLGKKSSIFKMFFNSTWRFFKAYFIKRGFLDGFNGFVISSLSAYTSFLKYLKLRQLHKKQKNKDKPKSTTKYNSIKVAS